MEVVPPSHPQYNVELSGLLSGIVQQSQKGICGAKGLLKTSEIQGIFEGTLFSVVFYHSLWSRLLSY